MGASRTSSHKASDTFERVTRSVEETEQVGEQLGRLLSAGDVVALIGELGSGKTTFIRGLAKGVGIDPEAVKSPTFILLREYPSALPLIHIDAYRLEHPEDAVWLDVEWMFSPRKVTVIEWADRIQACWPEDVLTVHLAHKSTHQRTLSFRSTGSRSQQVLDALRVAVGVS